MAARKHPFDGGEMEAYQTKGISLGGVSFNRANAIEFDALTKYEVTLAALVTAQTGGTLSSRTDDDTGDVTLSSGHGIVTSDKVDVYWAAGVRYGMTATVAGAVVTVDGGAGDVLPAASTTGMAVVKQTELNPLDLDGDNADVIAVVYRNALDITAKAHADFQDSGSATIREVDLVHETEYGGLDETADIAGGDTNNYTGNPVTKGFFSHDSTQAGKIYVLAGLTVTQ